MDSALSRLCAIPGHRDLNRDEARHVLDISVRSLERMTLPNAQGRTLLGCRRIEGGRGKINALTRYHGDGKGKFQTGRVQIPRVDVVIYLARHHTRKEDFLASLKQQCPQYLPAVLAALEAGGRGQGAGSQSQTLPENVIPMRGGKSATGAKAEAWHPNQLSLFGNAG
jgi:hypothetical protein